jgi:hypothetical protein
VRRRFTDGWACEPGSIVDVMLEAGVILTVALAAVSLGLAIRSVLTGRGLLLWAVTFGLAPTLVLASVAVFGLECAR